MNRKHIIRNLRAKNIAFDANASTAELQALLTTAANKISKVLNYAGGKGKIEVVFNNADESPAEIMICEEIGKDPWSGEGITARDIQATLNEITPKTRPLNFLTNSPGGSVSEGTAIRNILQQWSGRITNTIIGIAASTASWCIPADETRAYKSSQMFLHRSWGMVAGNADDMRSAITFLETTDGQIAQMLAEQCDGTPEEMASLMQKETLLTGQQAKDLGLVDTLIDGEAKNQFSPEQLNAMKLKLSALNQAISALPPQGERKNTNHNPPQIMQKKIALLNKRGITPPENATEAQLDQLIQESDIGRTMNIAFLDEWGVPHAENLTDAQLKALVKNGKPAPALAPALNADDQELLKQMRNQIAEQRKTAIRNRLQQLASAEGGHRIPVNEIENWETQALAVKDGPDGNAILNALAKLPEQQPGVAPINELPSNIEVTGAAFKDVQKFCIENGPGFRRQFLGAKAGNKLDERTLKDIGNRALLVANTIAKHKNMLIAMFNANAIDADLQRQVILQDMLEAYALNLIALEAFSVKYENVPLQGTDEVVVPYFPLQTNASTQFVKGTGYTTANDWTQNSRKVVIGGDGDAASNGANATAGYAKDRLYQRIDFTSYDMIRQPYLQVMKLAQQAANKLGVDVFSQIVSRVIVTGNFGAAVKTVAAALFTPDDIADLSEIADTAEWPAIARTLVLTNTYKTPLLKDNTFKQYLSYGATDPLRKAQIQEAYGFENMHFVPNLAAKLAANTAGWINHKSAVLVAFAPIMPTPEVRALLTTYDVAVEPRSGCVLEYRKFGNATTDTTQEVIESSFGAGPGVQAALKIIKSA